MMRVVFLALISLQFFGCASSSIEGTPDQEQQAKLFQNKPGMATIYVYYATWKIAATHYIFFNGKLHSHFGEGFTKVDAAPGKHTVTVSLAEDQNPNVTTSIDLYLDPGETAFLTMDRTKYPFPVYRLADNRDGMKITQKLHFYPGSFNEIKESASPANAQDVAKALTRQKTIQKNLDEARQAVKKRDYKLAIRHYTDSIVSKRTDLQGTDGRQELIDLVKGLKHPPKIPEAYRQRLIRGQTYLEMNNPEGAAEEFMQALNVAPWLPEAYYNYGVIEEKTGAYSRSEWAYNWYLQTNPDPKIKRQVKDNLVRIQLLAQQKLGIWGMNGIWVNESDPNAIYKVRVEKDQITIYAPGNAKLSGHIKGNLIDGFFTGGANKENGCLIPVESVPIYNSHISTDFHHMTIQYSYTLYKTQFRNQLFASEPTCVSVTPYGKQEVTLSLKKKK